MIRISICIVLLFCASHIKSQSELKVLNELMAEEESIRFQAVRIIPEGHRIMRNRRGQLFYELPGTPKDSLTELKPANIIIRISDTETGLLKDIALDCNSQFDPFFAASYFGERQFVVVAVRYDFYIISLSNYRVIGPLSPKPKGLGQDAISGMLGNFKVFGNGQYLFGTAADHGVFCYKLLDLYHPVELNGYFSDSPGLSPYFFFLDKRAETIYNGIYVNNASGNIDGIDFIFKGYKFEQDADDSVVKLELEKQYLLFKQYQTDGRTTDLIIDYKNGRILSYSKDNSLINRLLMKSKK